MEIAANSLDADAAYNVDANLGSATMTVADND